MLSKFLQNEEQMRLNIGKKLKTANLDSRFTSFKKEKCTWTCSLLKNLKPKDLKLLSTYEFTHQQPQRRLTSFEKITVWKKLFLFHIDPKI